jgi:hypothetical protein
MKYQVAVGRGRARHSNLCETLEEAMVERARQARVHGCDVSHVRVWELLPDGSKKLLHGQEEDR